MHPTINITDASGKVISHHLCKYCGQPVEDPAKFVHLQCSRNAYLKKARDRYARAKPKGPRLCRKCGRPVTTPRSYIHIECSARAQQAALKVTRPPKLCKKCHLPIVGESPRQQYHKACNPFPKNGPLPLPRICPECQKEIKHPGPRQRFHKWCVRKRISRRIIDIFQGKKIPTRTTMTIDQIHAYAAAHGGKCFDTVYHGSIYRYSFECSNHHKFKRSWNRCHTGGEWCPKCTPKIEIEAYCQTNKVTFERQEGTIFWFRCPVHGVYKAIHPHDVCFLCARRRRQQQRYAVEKNALVKTTDIALQIRSTDISPQDACKLIQCDPSIAYFRQEVIPKLEYWGKGDKALPYPAEEQQAVEEKIRQVNKILFQKGLSVTSQVIVMLALYSQYGMDNSQKTICHFTSTSEVTLRKYVRLLTPFFRPELRVNTPQPKPPTTAQEMPTL